MVWNSERFTASVATISAFCFAVLSVCAAVLGMQGCRQVQEGTDSTATAKDSTANEDSSASRIEERGSFQEKLPGCWKLRLTAQGAQRDSLRAWLPEGSLPSIIELDTVRAESAQSDSVYRARSYGGFPGYSFSIWRLSTDGSIRVQRAGALAGTSLQLKPTGEKLLGNVVVFTDTRGLNQSLGDLRRKGPVEAVPAECPRR